MNPRGGILVINGELFFFVFWVIFLILLELNISMLDVNIIVLYVNPKNFALHTIRALHTGSLFLYLIRIRSGETELSS